MVEDGARLVAEAKVEVGDLASNEGDEGLEDDAPLAQDLDGALHDLAPGGGVVPDADAVDGDGIAEDGRRLAGGSIDREELEVEGDVELSAFVYFRPKYPARSMAMVG